MQNHFSICDGALYDTRDPAWSRLAPLREACQQGLEFREPSWSGHCEPGCYPARGARWLTFPNWNDCTRDHIERGITESRSLHFPDSLTESSRRRIARLFNAYGA